MDAHGGDAAVVRAPRVDWKAAAWVILSLLVGFLLSPLIGAVIAAIGAWRTTGRLRVALWAIAAVLVIFALVFTLAPLPFGGPDFSETGSTPVT
jgi:MFS family permease